MLLSRYNYIHCVSIPNNQYVCKIPFGKPERSFGYVIGVYPKWHFGVAKHHTAHCPTDSIAKRGSLLRNKPCAPVSFFWDTWYVCKIPFDTSQYTIRLTVLRTVSPKRFCYAKACAPCIMFVSMYVLVASANGKLSCQNQWYLGKHHYGFWFGTPWNAWSKLNKYK